MSSEARNKWKKRKREPHLTKRQKQQQLEDDDEDDENGVDDLEGDEDYDLHRPNPNSNPNPNPNFVEILKEGDGVRICDFHKVVERTVNQPHSMVLAVAAMDHAAVRGGGDSRMLQNAMVLENVSYGQLQTLSAVAVDSVMLGSGDNDGGSMVLVSPPIVQGRGVVKQFENGMVLVVPMHSDWFSPNTVHRIERQVVPQYFSGKIADHTPEKYMECRNWIVAKYMQNPEKRLLISDCQGIAVSMAFDDISRVFRFLDQWGIINYCASDVPNGEQWNGEFYLKEDTSGEVHVPSDSLKSIDSLIKFEKPRSSLKPENVSSSMACNGDDLSDLDSIIQERFSESHCHHCSRPISIIHYQSQKEVDILLCPHCFNEGRFVTGHSSIDFVKVDSLKDYGDLDGESWTNQETLLLLEAVEVFHDNWNEIAEHVGSKSKAQCIQQFISLPVEDGLMESINVPAVPTSSTMPNGDPGVRLNPSSNGYFAGSFSHEISLDKRLPFAKSANPVMALVAFLTATIGPRVAASCAHAALAILSDENGYTTSGDIVQMEVSQSGNRISREEGLHGDITNAGLSNGSRSNGAETAPLSIDKVIIAAKAGLAAAAVKAKNFADHEEREVQRFTANIINHQLKRLELKLKQFAELETLLKKECDQVERMRQRIAAERAHTISTRFGPSGGITSSRSLQGMSALPMANNSNPSSSNNGQQHITQQVHPNMSFMPPQQTFGFGPRLPLTAIHPSSSSAAASNTMFNHPGSSQSTLRNPVSTPRNIVKALEFLDFFRWQCRKCSIPTEKLRRPVYIFLARFETQRLLWLPT